MRHAPPPARPGERITARRENELRELSRSSAVQTAGAGQVHSGYFGTAVLPDGVPRPTSVAIKTGASGIPAMAGDTPGKATDIVRQVWAGEKLAPANTITVYNVSTTAVHPNRYGKADDVDGRWIIDVESCA